MGPRSKLASAIVALVATILVAAPVLAASPWTTFKQSGSNAYASHEECVDNANGTITCEGQSIDVFEGSLREHGAPTRKGEQVCAGDYRYTFDPNTGEMVDSVGRFGCTFEAGTLTVDRLDSIGLAPTVIDLTAYVCDPSDCTESPAGSTTVHGTSMVWARSPPARAGSPTTTASVPRSMPTRAASARPRSRGRSTHPGPRWPLGPSPSERTARSDPTFRLAVLWRGPSGSRHGTGWENETIRMATNRASSASRGDVHVELSVHDPSYGGWYGHNKRPPADVRRGSISCVRW